MTVATIDNLPALTPEVLSITTVLEHALDGRCTHCFRPHATDEDWNLYEGGEGDHLCWEEDNCQWSFGVTREHMYAAALINAGVSLPA